VDADGTTNPLGRPGREMLTLDQFSPQTRAARDNFMAALTRRMDDKLNAL